MPISPVAATCWRPLWLPVGSGTADYPLVCAAADLGRAGTR